VDTNHDGVIQYEEFVPAILSLVSHRKGFRAPAAPAAPAPAPAPAPAAASGMPDLTQVPPEQLERYMQRLFKIGDKDGNGVLDALELRDLLRKSGFNLDNETIAHIMVGVDTNQDGVIQYHEFCRAIKDMVEDLKKSTAMPGVADMPHAELESYLQRLFKIGDRDGNGVLSPEEFESLLRKSGFKFDNATIRRIMNVVDTNHDGVIQYEEFVPAIITLLGSKEGSATSMPPIASVPSSQLELYMQRLFKIGDKDGNGVLDALEFRDLLRKSGFNLDDEFINRIMAAADTNQDGVIQFSEFVPAMKAVIERLPRQRYTQAAPAAEDVPYRPPNPASAPVHEEAAAVYGRPVGHHRQPAHEHAYHGHPGLAHHHHPHHHHMMRAPAFDPHYPVAPHHHPYGHSSAHLHRSRGPRPSEVPAMPQVAPSPHGRRSWML